MHRFFHIVRKSIDQTKNRRITLSGPVFVLGRITQVDRIDRRFGMSPPKALGIPALIDRNAAKPEPYMLVAFKSNVRTPKLNENFLIYVLGNLTGAHLTISNSIDINTESSNRIRHIA